MYHANTHLINQWPFQKLKLSSSNMLNNKRNLKQREAKKMTFTSSSHEGLR